MWNPTRGIWETSQLDLYGLLAPYSAIWPTSGTTRAGSAYPLPTSAHPTPAFASSSSPAALFRTPLAWVVAPLAILGCAYLFWSLPRQTQLYFLAWNVLGFVLYVVYARRNSMLGKA